MWPEPADGRRGDGGPLDRLDARLKVVASVLYVIAVIAVPHGRWRILGVLALALLFVIGLSGTSPRILLRRWAGLLALVAVLAFTVAPGIAERSGRGAFEVASMILAKNGLALLMMLTMAAVTPLPQAVRALGRLGLPRVLVETLEFMERYVHVLLDELDRMATARRARSFTNRRWLPWGTLTGLIGALLLRSFERAERVEAAMLARGWEGAFRRLEDPEPGRGLARPTTSRAVDGEGASEAP
ncbi:Nickel transport protein NikQ [Aquisphaera giovannonii]|uniref:Nickel transport protein NikQ n=1 Tax=Aquisphaera giovannonii TaxID=406548 RepID=A0A5B9VYV3_9BACT|nr:energy-coupling factor transporter transmembrane component T [Aquisphaera giovannonii]QEH33488.1 Nickel transport protein NikQ [Aquisphaera giovannonii]